MRILFILLCTLPLYSYPNVLSIPWSSPQTTIDFYVNYAKRYALAKRGIDYKNPFDQGLYKNIHRVFGNVPLYIHLLPNFTQPAPPMYAFVYDGQLCSDGDMCIV